MWLFVTTDSNVVCGYNIMVIEFNLGYDEALQIRAENDWGVWADISWYLLISPKMKSLQQWEWELWKTPQEAAEVDGAQPEVAFKMRLAFHTTCQPQLGGGWREANLQAGLNEVL